MTKTTTKVKTTAKVPAPSAPQPAGQPAHLTGAARAPEAPAPVMSADDTPPVLRKKEFLERVHAETGARKRDVREIVEATLKHLGQALANGETLALSPLGKVRVNRQMDKGDAEMLIVKIRRDAERPGKNDEQTSEEGLADTDD